MNIEAPLSAVDGELTATEKKPYDVFLCGDDRHLDALKRLLPELKGRGTVHLVSSFINRDNLRRLNGLYDVLHTPRLANAAYDNFKLFCLTTMNSVTKSSWFVKVDADVKLSSDWLNYVDETISSYPELVLFGPQCGKHSLSWTLEGRTIRNIFGSDIRVSQEAKVVGGFYCANTGFFKKHDSKLKVLTDLVYCFKNGVKLRPTKYLDEIIGLKDPEFKLKGSCVGYAGWLSEDNLRNLIVHISGAKNGVRVIPDSRVRVPPATSKKKPVVAPFVSQKAME